MMTKNIIWMSLLTMIIFIVLGWTPNKYNSQFGERPECCMDQQNDITSQCCGTWIDPSDADIH